MGFCDLPVAHQACDVVSGATKAVVGSAFQAVVDAFASGLATVVKALMTFWISTPEPDVSSSSGVISTLDGLTRPLVAFAAVVGLVVGGVRLAWTARAEQSGQAILRGLLLMTVVTAAGATVVEVMLTGFDLLATHVLNTGFDGVSVGEHLAELGGMTSVAGGGGLVFLLAFLGMLASLVQVGIMLVRGAILAVLVGVLPIAAGASITDAGYTWFKRLCGWIFSFALYKLVAAVIYAAAFSLIGTSQDLPGIVSGFSLIIVSVLALPALLRLIPPSAEAMGGGSGGALAGLVAAGATGAVALAGNSGQTAGPAPTATPGLKSPAGPVGSDGPGSQPELPSGSSGPGGAVVKGGSSAPPPPTGGGPAPGGPPSSGAAGAGPVGAVVSAGAQVHAAVKSAANNAAGDGGSQ